MARQYDHITDKELLELYYEDHDNRWIGILLERYTLLLLGVGMKYLKDKEEAKDMVQQVFLKVITELEKYRVEYFKSWIYSIARNCCLMKLRNKPEKFTGELSESMAATVPAEERQAALNRLENDRLLELLNASVEELNEGQKLCITLFYIEKLSYQQIAERTGLSVLQVKSNIQNGKRNLRIKLDQKLKNG